MKYSPLRGGQKLQETYDFDRMPKRSSTSIGCNSTFIYRSLYEENGADESIFFIDEAEDTTILGCKGVNLAKADYICLRKKGFLLLQIQERKDPV